MQQVTQDFMTTLEYHKKHVIFQQWKKERKTQEINAIKYY